MKFSCRAVLSLSLFFLFLSVAACGNTDGTTATADGGADGSIPGNVADGGTSPLDSSPADGALPGKALSDAGADAAPNPCAGVRCDDAPAAYCVDTTTLRTFVQPGTCGAGMCSYTHSDTTCAHGCSGGACQGADPCAGVLCDTPPAATCTNASTLETYSPSGTCAGGTCSYSATTTACANGCSSGACLGDPCAGVVCNSPPAAVCLNATTLESYSSAGTCSGGTCQYSPTSTPCANGCADGACTADPCAGVTCNAPPAPSCLNATTLETYGSTGTCAGGTCSYTATSTACPSGCANGACTADPCAGVTCDTPPAAYCSNATTLRTFASAGTCQAGTCSYSSTDTMCSAPTNATPSCSAATCGFTCNAGYVLSGGACVPACANECPAWGATCDGAVLQTCYVGNSGCLTLMTETCPLGCAGGACNTCPAIADPLEGAALTDHTGFYYGVVLQGSYAITDYQGESGGFVTADGGLAAVNVANPSAPTGGPVGPDEAFTGIALSGTSLYALDPVGILVFDVSTPTSPVLEGTLALADATSPKRDVSASGSLVCVAANDGLHLIDATTPSAPKAVGMYTQANVVPAIAVACSGRYAAVAGNNRIQIVDLHTPASPVMVADVAAGTIDPYGKSLAFDGVHAYETTYTEADSLDVYAFTPPATAGAMGSLVSTGSLGGITSVNAIAVSGTNVAFGGADSVGFIDVSNPSAPVFSKRALTTTVPEGVAANGSMLYASGTDLSVFDMSVAPPIVTVPRAAHDAIEGSAVVGSIGYLARSTSGLVIEDLHDPTNPVVLSTTGSNAMGVVVSGHYAFVASEATVNAGLLAYDISNPAAPALVGQVTVGQAIENLRLSNGRAYAMCGDGSLCVIDVGTPSSPTVLTGIDLSSASLLGISSIDLPFEIAGTDVYVPSGAGIAVIDVSNPASAKIVTTVTLAGQIGSTVGTDGSLALSGTTLYAVGTCTSPSVGDDCLYTIDVSTPASPKVLGVAPHTLDYATALYQENDDQPNFWQLNAAGPWATLSERWGGLVLFNVANPASPTVASEYFTVNPVVDAFVKDRFLTAYATSSAVDQVIDMCASP